jgi:hypothetical protein
VTASEFGSVLATGRKLKDGTCKPSETRKSYMLTLAGEILSGEVEEAPSTRVLERGHIMEIEARNFYALDQDVEPRQVGFLKRGPIGCSPDSLIGENGMLEIKSKMPKHHLQVLLDGEVPDDHKPQCYGGLWIAEREWIDFFSYWPKLPPFIKRVYRDEIYLAELAKAVECFLDELNDLVERLRARV